MHSKNIISNLTKNFVLWREREVLSKLPDKQLNTPVHKIRETDMYEYYTSATNQTRNKQKQR
jgi:hypothetical protein